MVEELKDIGVLVTRPGDRGESLSQLIEKSGGRAIRFPVIDIVELDDFTLLDEVLGKIESYRLIVFVSVSSARAVVSRLKSLGGVIPNTTKIAAVGEQTAKICEQFGMEVGFYPRNQVNSEGLIEELSHFDFKDQRVVIFRGQDGREWLGSEMIARGARVEYVQSYERKLTSSSIEKVLHSWRRGKLNHVIVTSASILEGLCTLLGEENRYLLKQSWVITISARLQVLCEAKGLVKVVVAKNPSDGAVMECLVSSRQS
jgi:uroporphyrinogen-III synthase